MQSMGRCHSLCLKEAPFVSRLKRRVIKGMLIFPASLRLLLACLASSFVYCAASLLLWKVSATLELDLYKIGSPTCQRASNFTQLDVA